MTDRVQVREVAGCLVARKQTHTDADRVTLAHEARLLASVIHPGVTTLLRCHREERDVDPDATDRIDWIDTRWVSGQSLATHPLNDATEIVRTVAAVAATIADLHDLGVAHGRIDVSHVLRDADGHPVLCGWSRGTQHADLVAKTTDVEHLARLLQGLLADRLEGTGSGLGHRRGSTGPSRRSARLIGALIESSTATDVGRRPTSRAFLATLLSAVPEARRSTTAPLKQSPLRDSEPRPSRSAHARRRRRPTPSIAALMAVAVTSVVVVGALTIRPEEPRIDTISHRPPTVGEQWTVLTGSGRVTNGEEVFQVATGDDQVVVRQWMCGQPATPAVLRPESGEFFVFDDWATTDTSTQARLVATIPDAREIDTTEHTCGQVHLTLADNRQQIVPIPISNTEELP